MSKTTRFMAELATSNTVMEVAERHWLYITLQQAHEVWSEHSDDYCAGWLTWRDDDPTNEILQALTAYQERHGKFPPTREAALADAKRKLLSSNSKDQQSSP